MPKNSYRYPQLALSLIAASLLACRPPAPVVQASPKPTPTPVQPLGTPIDLLQGRQLISGQLFDARTRQLVKAETEIRISGPDADKLEQPTLTFSNGTLGLALKPGVKPSAGSPLHLTVVAEAKGYFTASAQVHISDPLEAFSLNLTSKQQPPAGVGTGTDDKGQAGTDGALTSGVDLRAQAGGSQARFALSQGSVVTDRSGKPLSGPLSAQIGYFSTSTPEALNAFPGGFAPGSVNADGQNLQGYFQTGGFVSVDITDAAGNRAARFSQPAQVTIQMPAGTINPDTQKPVQIGDTIGIWSHDPVTGQWSKEATGTVAAGSSGQFNVTYSVGHLSYWNLDWFYTDRCNPVLRLNWLGNSRVPVMMSLLMDDANWYEHSNLLQDAVNQLYYVPVGRKLTFVAKSGNQEVGRTVVTLDKSCQPIWVNIDTQSRPQLRKVPVRMTLGSQTSFSRSEIQELGRRFGLSQELMAKLLAYTHPGDPGRPFSFDERAYQDVQNLGVSASQLQALRYLLSQTYSPSTYLSYHAENNPSDFGSVQFLDGSGEATLTEGVDYRFYGYIFYNNSYFYVDKVARLNSADSELRLDVRNVDLTIEVVRGFLAQLGMQLPQ